MNDPPALITPEGLSIFHLVVLKNLGGRYFCFGSWALNVLPHAAYGHEVSTKRGAQW